MTSVSLLRAENSILQVIFQLLGKISVIHLTGQRYSIYRQPLLGIKLPDAHAAPFLSNGSHYSSLLFKTEDRRHKPCTTHLDKQEQFFFVKHI